jgi:hypothetical protein
MIKYMTKNYTRVENKLTFEPNNIEDELLKKDSYSKITGRIWGCSESLSKIKGARDDVVDEAIEELTSISNDKSIYSVYDTYFSIHYVTIEQLRSKGLTFIPKLFDDFCKARFPAYFQQSKISM